MEFSSNHGLRFASVATASCILTLCIVNMIPGISDVCAHTWSFIATPKLTPLAPSGGLKFADFNDRVQSTSSPTLHTRSSQPLKYMAPTISNPVFVGTHMDTSNAAGLRDAAGDGAFTRTAWTLFFPTLMMAIMGKVTVFFYNFARNARGFAHSFTPRRATTTNVSAEEERKRNLEACKRVAKLGVFANLVLFVMQAVTGLAGGSAGMIAKAVDSFGDLMGDAVSYLSIKKAHTPPDAQHQFGHGKFESLGALSIATLLVIAAWEAATESWEALQIASHKSVFEGPSMFALYGAAASIVIKEGLYRIMMNVGKATNSDSTMANANHHRMDGFASAIVFVGIIGGRWGCKYADPVAGIFVAAIILKAAYDIACEAFNDLTDGIPNFGDLDINKCLTDAISENPGVVTYQNLRTRKMGPFVALQFDLLVDPGLTVAQVAHVEEHVKQHILKADESITEIGMRVLPAGYVAPAYGTPALAV